MLCNCQSSRLLLQASPAGGRMALRQGGRASAPAPISVRMQALPHLSRGGGVAWGEAALCCMTVPTDRLRCEPAAVSTPGSWRNGWLACSTSRCLLHCWDQRKQETTQYLRWEHKRRKRLRDQGKIVYFSCSTCMIELLLSRPESGNYEFIFTDD